MWKRLYVKYPLFLSDFNETLILSTDIRIKFKYKISSKFIYWKPSFPIRTDTKNRKGTFRKFANAPKTPPQPPTCPEGDRSGHILVCTGRPSKSLCASSPTRKTRDVWNTFAQNLMLENGDWRTKGTCFAMGGHWGRDLHSAPSDRQ